MADPVFLIENYFSSSQFSTHVVSAIQEAAGKQAFRVGDGRRIQLDHWSSTSLNVEAWIKVDCVSTKSATGIALDRGHNLAGKSVVLERSANDSGWTNVFTATIPATAATDGDIDDANGITTDEGAWLKRFASVSDRYWRLRIPAMGADLKPEVVGLWVGNTWEPGALTLPHQDEYAETMVGVTENTLGWQSGTQAVRRRTGELALQLATTAEVAAIAALKDFDLRRPMWIVLDGERTERAVLAIRPSGRFGLGYDRGWFPRQGRIPWIELQPEVA